MKTPRTVALALFTAAATLAGAAHADAGLSRAQVKAELVQAQRSGDLVDYETGRKLNELFPGAYAAKGVAAGHTVAVEELPATAAGPAAVGSAHKPQAIGVRNVPWDYAAISDRNAEALARGHGAR